MGSYSGAARREPGAKSRRNLKIAVTLSKSFEVSEIISAYALKPAPQGVNQKRNLAEVRKSLSLFESLEVLDIVSA